MLTTQEKLKIYDLKDKDYSLNDIAKAMEMPRSTISSFLLKYPVNDIKYVCFQCGKEFIPPLGRRTKHFCCKKCRQTYKNAKRNKDLSFKKTFVCEECGVVFMASKYKKRRFCSRECFQSFESRRWNEINEGK